MQQQSDSWYQWYDTCTDAVREAMWQCQRWGEQWWGVFYVPHKGKYLIGKVNNYGGAKHIANVHPLGSITRYI